jgi:hypothetical protein
MLPIAALASLAAWWAITCSIPCCIYCRSGDIRHAPREREPYRYECGACRQAFTNADDRPVGFLEAIEALSRRSELYAD